MIQCFIFAENSIALSATAGTGGSSRRADPGRKRHRHQLAWERDLTRRDHGNTLRGSAAEVYTPAELHYGDRGADREDAATELPAERAEDRKCSGGEQRAATEAGVAATAAGLRDRPGGNESERRADVARSRRDRAFRAATGRDEHRW